VLKFVKMLNTDDILDVYIILTSFNSNINLKSCLINLKKLRSLI